MKSFLEYSLHILFGMTLAAFVVFGQGCAPAVSTYRSRAEEPPSPRPQEVLATVETNNLTFDLIRCLLNNQTLGCHFAITNRGVDRNISIKNNDPYVTLYDSDGNLYSRASQLAFLPGQSGQFEVSKEVFYSKTIFAEVFFRVNPNINGIKQLEIPVGSQFGSTKITFYDLPISKKEPDGSVRMIPLPVTGRGASDDPNEDSADKSRAVQRYEVRDFVFDLEGCILRRQDLTCTVRVLNRGTDNFLRIRNDRGETDVFDDTGREYMRGEELTLANKRSPYEVEHLIFNNLPVKATIVFNIPPDVQKLKQMEFPVYIGNKKAIVVFRDITIAR